MSGRAKRILCLWLPSWPIQRVRAAARAARQQPVPAVLVLVQRDPRRGQVVTACCHEAGRWGVSPGQPLVEARSLLPRRLVRNSIQHYQPERDRQALQDLARECESLCPLVGLEMWGTASDEKACLGAVDAWGAVPGAPASLLMDVTGVTERWGGEQPYSCRLLETVARQGYQGRIGVADSIGAAWALAHFATAVAAPDPLAASDSSSAIAIAPPGASAALLAELPVAALRLPAATLQMLHDLGLARIEQLQMLPRSSIAVRLGNHLVQRLAQAQGEIPELILRQEEVEPFVVEWQAEHPTGRREEILEVVQHLCHHLAQGLAARQQGALQLHCAWRMVGSTREEFTVGLFRPTLQADRLWRAMRYSWEQLSIRHPISWIGLRAHTVPHRGEQQLLLWDLPSQSTGTAPWPSQPANRHEPHHDPEQNNQGQESGRQDSRALLDELGDLIERLSSRLGSAAVYQAQLRAAKLPETAYRLLPLTGLAGARRSLANTPGSAPLSSAPPSQRPLELLPQPAPIRTNFVHLPASTAEGTTVPSASEPADADSLMTPAGYTFAWRGHTYHIRHWQGPERIETSWWQGPSIRRDYYRVACACGNRFWLFEDLSKRRWFLHGCFG